jgi:hypothetical protein
LVRLAQYIQNCSAVGDCSGYDLADKSRGCVLPKGIYTIGDELIEVELHNDFHVGISSGAWRRENFIRRLIDS